MQQHFPNPNHRQFQHQWPPRQHMGQMQQMPNQFPPHQAQTPYPDTGFMTRQILIEDAIKIAREQVQGQVVSAELDRRGGRLIYEIEIISTQGPKYEVHVDSSTGEVLNVQLD